MCTSLVQVLPNLKKAHIIIIAQPVQTKPLNGRGEKRKELRAIYLYSIIIIALGTWIFVCLARVKHTRNCPISCIICGVCVLGRGVIEQSLLVMTPFRVSAKQFLWVHNNMLLTADIIIFDICQQYTWFVYRKTFIRIIWIHYL